MKLATIINRKKNALYKEYEDKKIKMALNNLEQMQHDINFVTEVLDNLNKDVANLRYIETKKVLDILYDNIKMEQEKNVLEEQLRIIKLIFNAKYDEHLDLSITENQIVSLDLFKQSLERLNVKLKDKLSNLKNSEQVSQGQIDALQDDIINLEIIHEKVVAEKGEVLTEDDFQLLYKIVEDPKISYGIKKDLLVAIKKYNSHIIDHSSVDINAVKELFEKYGVDKEIFKYIDKCWKEINKNLDLDNIKAILDYLSFEDLSLDKRNILLNFDVSTLLAITVYGTVESVQNAYQKIINNKQEDKIFFQTSSVWINNLPKSKKQKRSKHSDYDRKLGQANLYVQAHEVSYEEILNSEKFLKAQGFNVSMNQAGNVKLLKTPLYKIEENYDICKLYGLVTEDKSNFSTSTLWFSNLAESCDRFIELGLLHCPSANDYPYADTYTIKYPTIMNTMREATIALLYKLIQTMSCDDYYKTIFSKHHSGMLSTNLTLKNLGYDLKSNSKFDEFKKENFIDQSENAYLPNYNEYESILFKENDYKFDTTILNDSFIKELDEKYKVKDNEYVYVVDNQIISRFKVLRIYGLLKKNNLLMDDAKLFALTYGSYINEETFSKLASISNYSYEGGANGISKTI